jgi:tryptophan halogenase
MKKIVIIGGGTAGWLTALYVQNFWLNTEIKLIENSKIGILGAGEGVTPNFGASLKLLGIDELDFIKNTKSTIKTALNFINWRGDGKSTLHPFMLLKKGSIDEKYINNGYHMDARLVAAYFKKIAIDRGVMVIDNEVIDFKTNGDDITEIILKDDTLVKPDFVFDCSGFARLTMNKIYKQKWISYKEYLTVNSAFAYFLPQENIVDENTKTKTNMISMKHGWMWQAPLQHRWGCGYVYNDKYTTLENAKKEVEDYLSREIEIVKTFKYEAGTYEKCWIGNCVSNGLSSTFLEPLESTALMSTIMILKKLEEINFDIKYRDKVNQFFREITEQNMLFVRYHYMCDRNDTQFWKDYKNVPIPEKLTKLINSDGSIKFNSAEELMKILDIKESPINKLTFMKTNYEVIYRKNSLKFTNNII